MPTLRSRSAASPAGNVRKSCHISEQGMEAATVLSNPSSPGLGPCTPAQNHEAARAEEPYSGSIIRRSRRFKAEVTMATVEATLGEGVPEAKAKSRRGRPSKVPSLLFEESIKGKRKADDILDREVAHENISIKDAALDESLSASFASQVDVESPVNLISASGREAFDRTSVAPSLRGTSRGRGRGRRTGRGRGRGRGRYTSEGLEAMIGDGMLYHRAREPFSFDLNQCLIESSSSDEAFDDDPIVDMHLDSKRNVKIGDVAMSVENNRQETEVCDVLVHADNDPEEKTAADKAAEVMIDSSSDSETDTEAGPSHRPQVEEFSQERRSRGRGRGRGRGAGRRGGAEASRSRFLQIARDRASHFAHFDADGDEAPAGAPPPSANVRRRGRQPRQVNQNGREAAAMAQQVDWPGPFSTARQLVNNRADAAAARQSAGAPGNKVSLVDWHPTRRPGDPAFCSRKCPSLQDLCLNLLSNNAESVISLEGVPELFKVRISNAFCERRKMSAKVLSLFFQGDPSEIHSLDCTQINEDELIEMMRQISPGRLEKLHLDHCGRALSERCLQATIASSSTMSLLKHISFRGAYRLSDGGLEAVLRASPQLVYLDLSTCSFLTNASIRAVASCVSETLESLVLDGCPNLNATVFIHDIVRLQKLQKISLGEVSGVTDEVVSELCVQLGSHLRELVLAGCKALTDAAIAAIGPCCPSLEVLNLANLSLLTDVAVAHIADNLQKLETLNVRRCKFSDEAIAAFVTASGAMLHNFSLNSVHEVAEKTTVAIAKHSHTCLEYLDLSFCRLVDDECLGLLADACLQLQELKLYGCTQVTNKFLCGHSNPSLKVVGLTN